MTHIKSALERIFKFLDYGTNKLITNGVFSLNNLSPFITDILAFTSSINDILFIILKIYLYK